MTLNEDLAAEAYPSPLTALPFLRLVGRFAHPLLPRLPLLVSTASTGHILRPGSVAGERDDDGQSRGE
jgi:hypothetical protein